MMLPALGGVHKIDPFLLEGSGLLWILAAVAVALVFGTWQFVQYERVARSHQEALQASPVDEPTIPVDEAMEELTTVTRRTMMWTFVACSFLLVAIIVPVLAWESSQTGSILAIVVGSIGTVVFSVPVVRGNVAIQQRSRALNEQGIIVKTPGEL